MGEHAGDQALALDLLEPSAAPAGEQDLLFEPLQGGLDRLVVRLFDLLGNVLVGQRPQGRDRLDRHEGQVVAGHRGGLLACRLRHERAAFPVIERGPAVLALEELVAQFAADPGPLLRRHCCLPVVAAIQVVGDVPLRSLLDELGLVARVDREDPTELGGLLGLTQRPAGVQRGVLEALGERVAALPEQVPHVLLGDLGAHLEVERTESGTEPAARRLALLGVVVGQSGVPAVGGVVHGDLPSEVRVPVPGRQLVQTHHVGRGNSGPHGSDMPAPTNSGSA